MYIVLILYGTRNDNLVIFKILRAQIISLLGQQKQSRAQLTASPKSSNLSRFEINTISVEDQNFALFNYVNELNNSIETIQEQINTVCGLIVWPDYILSNSILLNHIFNICRLVINLWHVQLIKSEGTTSSQEPHNDP